MKRIASTIITLVILSDLSFAQSSYPDSLLNINAQLPDNKEKADNYLLLTRYYRTLDYDSAWKYSEKTYRLAYMLNYPETFAEAIYIQSLLLSSQDNYQESMALNELYIHLADSLNDEKKLAKGYYNKGNQYLDLLDYDNARLSYGKSLPGYLTLGDTLGILANYNAIGRIFLTQSMYDSAAVYFLKSLEICEQAGESQLRNMSSVIDNLSNVYLQLGQYDKALEYSSKSLEIDKKTNQQDKIADDYNDFGRIYNEMGKTSEALEYYRMSRDLFLKMKDTVSVGNVDNNIGVLYTDLEKPEQAIRYFDEALAGYMQKDFTRGLVVVYGNKGVALSLLGRYEEAISLMEKVINLSDKYGLSDYRKDALVNISWYWMKLGNYQKAYDYQSRSYALKDSIFDLEKTRIINDLTLKYERQKDQAKILELENITLQKDLDLKRSTIQRNAYLFTGLGIWATALFILLYYRQKTRKNRIIAAQKIRQLEEEKKFMAARLIVEGQEEERKRIARELHDGLGVLLSATKMQFTSIKDISPENRPIIEKATRLLEQASGDVRKISHNMMPGLLTKLGLYEAIEDLVENLSESGKIKAACDIPENLQRMPENTEIMIYRIIQEMVNNTLKYASAQNLMIKMTEQPGLMEIQYSDDGAGFNVEEKTTSKSIGLSSIQSRVHFLNGKMELRSAPGKGVHYMITLPDFSSTHLL